MSEFWGAGDNHFLVSDNTGHLASGWHFHQIGSGGEDPEDRRRRHMLIAAQKEDKLIISIVKAYMKQVF